MNVFEAVKQSVTVREAAEMYGIEVKRNGMACCPFHDDKNPSMKLNEEYFYCFGCGATGDMIDFAARLYNLSPKEAAEKLAQDFGLTYDSQAPPKRRYVRQKTEAQKFREDREHSWRVLADYYHLLQKWETDYSPKTPEENPHPRFMEAVQRKEYIGYLLDFFLEDSPEEQKLWIAEHQSEIADLERRVKFMADKPTNRERLQEITAGIEQGNDPFVQQVMADVGQIAAEEAAEPEPEQPAHAVEPVAVYPGDKNNLPYDAVVQTLRTNEPEPEQKQPQQPALENFRIMDDALGTGGPKEKFWRNIKAIATLKQIEQENRHATLAEQHLLSQYVGWGGLADAFDQDKPAWAAEYSELKELLTPEEYAAARGSTLNAHYTSPTVIRAIYEAVGRMGFKTGNILEPSCGVGNFFGMLPESMAGSKMYGVELDPISGRIAQQLYPKADITVAGFETTDRRDFYDLAVGNVPFGQYQVNDRAYNKLGFNIHNYFFAKSMDQVRPGGVIAFVTSRYTMDAKDSTVRRYLAQRAELLGAIRLPNNAFRANAGTDVVSDIIFLQKRDRPLDIAPEWTQIGQTEDGFAINSYFLDHPEMVLGRPTAENTQYGKQDYTVVPIEGLELADQLHDAVKYIRGTYQEAELPELGEGEAIDTSIPADPNVKN